MADSNAYTSPALGWSSLATGGLGTLMSIYGMLQQQDQAQKNYELQKQQFDRESAIQNKQMADQEAAQQTANTHTAGTYAQNLRDDQMNPYLAWYNKVGG